MGPEARRSGYLKVPDARPTNSHWLRRRWHSISAPAPFAARGSRSAGLARCPWRLPAVEGALRGRPPNADVFRGAAALAADGAKPLRENGFKVELLKRTVERQLATVAAMP